MYICVCIVFAFIYAQTDLGLVHKFYFEISIMCYFLEHMFCEDDLLKHTSRRVSGHFCQYFPFPPSTHKKN